MTDDPVKALRDALTPVLDMHAERFRIGEPTNADRLRDACLKHLPAVLEELEAHRELSSVVMKWAGYVNEPGFYDHKTGALYEAAKAFWDKRGNK